MRRALREGPPALAAEGDEFVVAAVAATQAQEVVRLPGALQESVELVLHELRQAGAGGDVSLGKEGLGVLLHQPVQHGPLGAVAPVVDRGAIVRPVGPPTDGLRALLTSSLW